MAIKHNKKKNAGIVFEQLLMVATRLAASKKTEEVKFVMEVIKKYFHPKTELGKERNLIETMISTRNLDKPLAEEVLTETLKEAETLNADKLEREKQSLISTINKKLSKEIYNINVTDYKLLASAQTIFNEARNNYKYTNPKERVKIKSTLLEHMTQKKEVKEGLAVDDFTYKFAIRKFNKKYGKLLNEDQQDILRVYLMSAVSGNEEELKSLLEQKIDKINLQFAIHERSDKHTSDVYKSLISETRESLKDFSVEIINEDVVYKVMRYFDAIEDLEEIAENAN